MFIIVEKEKMNDAVTRFVIEAPRIARKRQPGQFVIFRLDECGERFPITIAGGDAEKGTITVYVQALGKTTTQMAALEAGQSIADVAGPLGRPTPVHKLDGDVFLVAGGVGAAEVLPIARRHHEIGNTVKVILGARSKDILILEDEFRSFAAGVYVTTDDGSRGRKGFVTDELKTHLEGEKKISEVIAVGPVIMMKNVCNLTRGYAVPTMVSLNTIMIDGTGMCGGCRVEIGGQTRYTCVDGPEFDGHAVNFDLLIQRLGAYRPQEKESHECYLNRQGGNRA
jgi:ferredoxin--NADP+ reductase